jgi:predicted nucleotidyltransferase component of viral defense system
MIPQAHVIGWRKYAHWSTDAQVEQDLVICRAIVEIFSDPFLRDHLAFRGGTALHKLYLTPPARYSEDIDLVQVEAAPIGQTIDVLRGKLDPWLGMPRRRQSEGRVILIYRFESEIPPITPLRLKVEINTREHFSLYGFVRKPFALTSPYFQGSAALLTYEVEEFLGTKLRALYQRSKGRDLFDLSTAIDRVRDLDHGKIVKCFERYLRHEDLHVSRAEFEANLFDKMNDKAFHEDMQPLLVAGAFQADAFDSTAFQTSEVEYEAEAAYRQVKKELIEKLPGEPWKGGNQDKR